jgi:hypothetical protein
MKKLSILLLFLSLKSFSQEKPANLILKTTPSYIFDIDNTFTIGAEYFLKKYMSVQTEIGYGNTNQNLLIAAIRQSLSEQKPYRNFDVFRGKVEMRFYTKKADNHVPDGFYYAVEGFYKYVGKEDYIRIGRDAVNFQPEYWEFVVANKKRQVFGSHFKIGRQFYIFDANPNKMKKWMFDFYMGIGFRNINNRTVYDSKREFDQINTNGNDFGKIFNENGKQNIISGTLGFKLGYIIK